ncbi:hypothetical protein KRP22_010811 [Phytophthora ramorum]|uniref:Uncharacterized protein n=1 Tax=Phytophthora ramorum TaxID=164328 RepID=H3GJ29_PHYRM|nr:hypothetical protein KRP23_5937 [Phytophthora ramorum]KAH7504834.1 hypothetical protein KRP22_5317 [Phytophthora ramorum]
MTAHERVQGKDEPRFKLEKKEPIDETEDDNLSSDSADDASQPPLLYSEVPRIAWDWICWSGAKTFDGMDFAGEVLANFLGLTQSKYQWILDAHEREEEEELQRRLEKQQRRQLRLEQLLEEEQQKLQELETGALEEDSESVKIPTSTTV